MNDLLKSLTAPKVDSLKPADPEEIKAIEVKAPEVKEEESELKKASDAVTKAAAGRVESNIPLTDPYWEAVANLRIVYANSKS